MKIIFLFVLLIFFILNGCSSEIKQICFEDDCFNVQIADSDGERAAGLMNRDFLEVKYGMLFIFEKEGIYPFWMKNTLIPLDIIWINSYKEIIFIKENAQPCKPFEKSLGGKTKNNLFEEKDSLKKEECETFVSDMDAKYVLELNSGKVKELGIKIGDKVKFL